MGSEDLTPEKFYSIKDLPSSAIIGDLGKRPIGFLEEDKNKRLYLEFSPGIKQLVAYDIPDAISPDNLEKIDPQTILKDIDSELRELGALRTFVQSKLEKILAS